MRATLLAAALGALTLWACSPASPDAPLYRYIVQLSAPPLVSYAGGVAGLAPTSAQATGASRVNLDSPASRAYTGYLRERQATLLTAVKDTLGRPVTPDYAYFYAMDGIVLRLTPAEAARVGALPDVTSVRLDLANPTLSLQPPPQH